MISNRNNFLTAHFHRNRIQCQRRNQSLTLKTSNLLFDQSSQQKIKHDLDRQSPILIRRFRPTIENHISHQQSSDITDVLGNQLQLISRTSSLHSKTTKFSQDKKIISSSKSYSLQDYDTHYQSRNEKKIFISNNDFELFKKMNVKDLVDEWEDPKSNVAVSSDDDDSIINNFNKPILTYNSQKSDQFGSATYLQRHSHNFSLAPVVEDINDE